MVTLGWDPLEVTVVGEPGEDMPDVEDVLDAATPVRVTLDLDARPGSWWPAGQHPALGIALGPAGRAVAEARPRRALANGLRLGALPFVQVDGGLGPDALRAATIAALRESEDRLVAELSEAGLRRGGGATRFCTAAFEGSRDQALALLDAWWLAGRRLERLAEVEADGHGHWLPLRLALVEKHADLHELYRMLTVASTPAEVSVLEGRDIGDQLRARVEAGESFDLVVHYYRDPGMWGPSLVADLRAGARSSADGRGLRTAALPFLALTCRCGCMPSDVDVHLLAAGADDVLGKPFRRVEWHEALCRALRAAAVRLEAEVDGAGTAPLDTPSFRGRRADGRALVAHWRAHAARLAARPVIDLGPESRFPLADGVPTP